MDTLQLYRQALVLARHGNYARAAEALGIAQPNLTRAIASLERSLGVRLFDRGRSGAVTTAFGRVFVERAEQLLRSDAELRRELQLLADLATGTLRIACGPYAAEAVVADAVARLVAAHPKVRIECLVMTPEHVVTEVLSGHVDIGVSTDATLQPQPELEIERFAPLRVHLACRPEHPLTQERQLTLARALQYPLVTTRLRGADALQVMPGFEAATAPRGVLPELVPPILVNSLAMGRQIARGSDALFSGFAAQLADDVRAGRLVLLDVDDALLRNSHAVYHRRDRPLAPAAALFRTLLRELEQELQLADAPPRRGRLRRA
ncbi:MAG: LysR family transcriptional regulator [Rubrivivax sp.]|nr:LysR family transcriptional regulator [Rubrivivax sp.]